MAVLIGIFIPATLVQKGENYTLLHTYTIATNLFPLVPEVFTCHRNIHRKQAKKYQKGATREGAKCQDKGMGPT
jgi:hypothetical protein